MAVTDAYATASEYRAAVSKSDTGEDAEILTDLTAVSRYLDKRLGRFFTKDAAPVARIYVVPPSFTNPPLGWAESENPWRHAGLKRVLAIDDLAEAPTSIKWDDDLDGVLDTTLAVTDYEMLPRNAPLGPEPRPYTEVELTEWGAHAAWPARGQVEVVGVWGWPAVPQAIKSGAIQLTAILRLETPRATRRVDEMGTAIETSRAAQEIVQELLRHYKKVRI